MRIGGGHYNKNQNYNNYNKSNISSGNHYEVLGVSKNATSAQIKTAFKKLCLQYHPDQNPQNPQKAAENFKKLRTAYDILSNPREREKYDLTLTKTKQQSAPFNASPPPKPKGNNFAYHDGIRSDASDPIARDLAYTSLLNRLYHNL